MKRLMYKNMIYKIIIVSLIIIISLIIYKYQSREIKNGTLEIYKETENKLENEQSESSGFIVLVNSNIVIKNNTANILAQNIEHNNDDCRVKLYNGDNLLYESDILYSGTYIENVKLFNSDIDTTKDSEVIFEILDSEGEVKNTTTIKVNITKE